MRPSGRVGTPLAVPCGASVTDCSGWPASFSDGGCFSIPTMVRPPLRRLQRSRRLTLSLPQPALQQSAARKSCPGGRKRPRRQAPGRSVLCAGHVQQPGGESPLCNLMEVKHERSARAGATHEISQPEEPGQTHEGLRSYVWGSFGEVTAPETLLIPMNNETSEQIADLF